MLVRRVVSLGLIKISQSTIIPYVKWVKVNWIRNFKRTLSSLMNIRPAHLIGLKARFILVVVTILPALSVLNVLRTLGYEITVRGW